MTGTTGPHTPRPRAPRTPRQWFFWTHRRRCSCRCVGASVSFSSAQTVLPQLDSYSNLAISPLYNCIRKRMYAGNSPIVRSRTDSALIAAATKRILITRDPLLRKPTTTTTSCAPRRPITTVHGFNSSTIGPRNFPFIPPEILNGHDVARPKLILISGCTGTGKSTFGMSVALDQGILRCVSTDTIRSVMRSFIAKEISPALHRSSYSPSHSPTPSPSPPSSSSSSDGKDVMDADISASHIQEDDPVQSWRETCDVLAASVEGLVDDALSRNVSLVVEGVHVVPNTELIKRWEDGGGIGVGCLLTIKDEEAHRALLKRRGDITGRGEVKKIEAFDRVRAIQDEMIRLATDADWMLVKQRLEPDPLELVAAELWTKAECKDETRVSNAQLHVQDKE